MNQQSIIRLTALWALSESGLGGMLFALKIPLTGFLLGGFAVLLISLIAWFSRFSFKDILGATLLVLIIKAAVSPHSSPMAYIAVAFQGIMGALLFSLLKNYRLAALLLGVLALVESAIQKILVLLLIFGKDIWTAVDEYFKHISREFSLPDSLSFSWLLIAVYISIYFIWGLVLGYWAGRLPAQVQASAPAILAAMPPPAAVQVKEAGGRKPNYMAIVAPFLLILLFLLIVLFLRGNSPRSTVTYILIRSLLAVLLLLYVVRPALQWCISRWLKSKAEGRRGQVQQIMQTMPMLQRYIRPAWQMAAAKTGYWQRLRYFVLCLTVLTIYGE